MWMRCRWSGGRHIEFDRITDQFVGGLRTGLDVQVGGTSRHASSSSTQPGSPPSPAVERVVGGQWRPDARRSAVSVLSTAVLEPVFDGRLRGVDRVASTRADQSSTNVERVWFAVSARPNFYSQTLAPLSQNFWVIIYNITQLNWHIIIIFTSLRQMLVRCLLLVALRSSHVCCQCNVTGKRLQL